MAENKPTPSLDDLPKARVVVVGDAINDIWIYGRVERISPEGPWPVFLVEKKVPQHGGAGNVAANLSALGIRGTVLVSQQGKWGTPTKTRYVAGQYQLLRVDEEEVSPLTPEAEGKAFNAATVSSDIGCLILSDYGKGMLTPGLCNRLIKWAQNFNIPVVVDPKGDDWSKYAGATVITPNEKEAAACNTRLPEGTNFLITRGPKGMSLKPSGIDIPAQAREVFDVVGAGDTVVAVLGACLAVGFDMEAAARIANAAAGVVVGKRGTAVCSLDELKAALICPSNIPGFDDAVNKAFETMQNELQAPLVKKMEELVGLRSLPNSEQRFWCARVREIVATKPRVRDVAHWEKGWAENLAAYQKSGDAADLRPRYIRSGEPVRWQGKFWMHGDPDFEWHWYRKFFAGIAEKWIFPLDPAGIIEFGSGSGHNLAWLKARLNPRRTVLVGCDWSDAAVEIANLIDRGYKFDLTNPGVLMLGESNVVFTVGAMEQTGMLWRPMLNYLLAQKPRRVIHIEPIVEWYDRSNPVDLTAIEAHKARGFWEGYLGALQKLAAEGKVEIEHEERTGFGSLLIEGYSQIVWRPL